MLRRHNGQLLHPQNDTPGRRFRRKSMGTWQHGHTGPRGGPPCEGDEHWFPLHAGNPLQERKRKPVSWF